MEEILDVLLQAAAEIFTEDPRVWLWLGGALAALATVTGLALWLLPRSIGLPLVTGILGVLVFVLIAVAWWRYLRRPAQ